MDCGVSPLSGAPHPGLLVSPGPTHPAEKSRMREPTISTGFSFGRGPQLRGRIAGGKRPVRSGSQSSGTGVTWSWDPLRQTLHFNKTPQVNPCATRIWRSTARIVVFYVATVEKKSWAP